MWGFLSKFGLILSLGKGLLGLVKKNPSGYKTSPVFTNPLDKTKKARLKKSVKFLTSLSKKHPIIAILVILALLAVVILSVSQGHSFGEALNMIINIIDFFADYCKS